MTVAPTKTRGTFWSAEDSNSALDGELTCSQGSGAHLDLDGLLDDPLPGKPRTICGTTITGELVTLFDAYFDGWTRQGATTSVTSRHTSYLAAIGNHYRQLQDVTACQARVAIDGLSYWAWVSAGIEPTTDQDGTNVIRLHQATPLPLGVHDDLTIALHPVVQEHWSFGRILIQHDTLLTLTAPTDQPFEKLHEVVRAFAHFLALSTGMAHDVNGMTLFPAVTPQIGVPPPSRTVQIIQAHPLPGPASPRRPPGARAHLAYLGPDSALYVTTFLQKYTILKPVLDLWHATVSNPHLYLEHSFLSLAYATETCHAALIGGQYMPKAEYLATVYPLLKAAIPATLGEEFRHSLAGRLRYHYGFELRRRVHDLCNRVATVATALHAANEEFATRVAAMRNTLAHDGTLPKGVSWEDVATISEKLGVILRAVLLTEADVPEDNVRQVVLAGRQDLMV